MNTIPTLLVLGLTYDVLPNYKKVLEVLGSNICLVLALAATVSRFA